MLAVQRGNTNCCLAEKKTQLSSRTMKLALMDVKGCVDLSENNNTLLTIAVRIRLFSKIVCMTLVMNLLKLLVR